jgi:hypothetical protein
MKNTEPKQFAAELSSQEALRMLYEAALYEVPQCVVSSLPDMAALPSQGQ